MSVGYVNSVISCWWNQESIETRESDAPLIGMAYTVLDIGHVDSRPRDDTHLSAGREPL